MECQGLFGDQYIFTQSSPRLHPRTMTQQWEPKSQKSDVSKLRQEGSMVPP